MIHISYLLVLFKSYSLNKEPEIGRDFWNGSRIIFIVTLLIKSYESTGQKKIVKINFSEFRLLKISSNLRIL